MPGRFHRAAPSSHSAECGKIDPKYLTQIKAPLASGLYSTHPMQTEHFLQTH